MLKRLKYMKVGTRLFLMTGIAFIMVCLVIILLVNFHMRCHVVDEARNTASALIDHVMATHNFFTEHLNPDLLESTNSLLLDDNLKPAWMSSAFTMQKIDKYSGSSKEPDIVFKECSINARNIENEANQYERAFLDEMNSNPDLTKRSSVLTINDEPFFVFLRRGEVMRESCLQCHSSPNDAPEDLVRIYGPDRSFNRKVGEVFSAISVGVPLSAGFANANRLSIELSGLLLFVILYLFTTFFWLNKSIFINPLSKIRNKALEILANEKNLGELIEVPPGKELKELTEAFNRMSIKLRVNMDELEKRVDQRTVKLRTEIGIRRKAEHDKEILIGQLKNALSKVKTLKGLIPICAICKKIRDDNGYWNQLEAYFREHSEARFSHGICPECSDRIYPDLRWVHEDV